MLLFIASAFANEGAVRCTATLRHASGSVKVQAFAADFESGKERAVEHAWLVAEIHQHSAAYLGAVESVVAGYAAFEPPQVPRVPGYEVKPGACEMLGVTRHSGDWDAGWGDTYVTSELPWVALETARRRHCFGAYEEGMSADIQKASTALMECLQAEAKAPKPALRPLKEEVPAAPRFLCTHTEGWVGGGVSLYEAREDAHTARLVGVSRETVGGVFTAIEARTGTPPPAIDFVHDSIEDENAALTCTPPGRNLSFQTTSTCAGSSRRLTASVGVDSAEIGALCHAAHYEPTLSMLPSTLETGLPATAGAGAIGLASSCDAACRKGFQ